MILEPMVKEGFSQGELPQSILAMDLSFVRTKLEDRALVGREKNCPPVLLSRLEAALEDYKKYLFLNLKYEGFPLVPSFEIDEVWHQHILFTEQYAVDCQAIFGGMRHHIPHFRRIERNVAEDLLILENTKAIWRKEFAQVPVSYEGMTELTSTSKWSGNMDLSMTNPTFWESQTRILAG